MENKSKGTHNLLNSFYTFKKILKSEFLYDTTDKLLKLKREFEKKKKNKLTVFEKLAEYMEKILNNKCEQVDKVFGYGEELKVDNNMLDITKRITIARLACYIKDHHADINVAKVYSTVIPYIDALENIEAYASDYYVTQFIHSTRGLLDTDSPETSIRFAVDLVNYKDIKQYEMSDNERDAFNDVIEFWKAVVMPSVPFGLAIESLINYYDLKDVTSGDIFKYLEVMKIDTVVSKYYFGMVGFNGIIFSDSVFVGIENDRELVKRRILRTLIHECAQYILRIVDDDFGYLSPTNKHPNVNAQFLESGFFIEEILFGDCTRVTWKYKHLMDKNLWLKSDIPIIPEEDLKGLDKTLKKNLCSSGFQLFEEIYE
jgi:hypothetical protein